MYVKVESYIREKNNPTIMYFISNTTNKDLIIETINNKWKIENKHHKNKDCLLDEDLFRIADATAVANIVAFNDVVLSFFKIAKATLSFDTLKKTRTAFELEPEKYLTMVLSIIESKTLIKKIKELNHK